MEVYGRSEGKMSNLWVVELNYFDISQYEIVVLRKWHGTYELVLNLLLRLQWMNKI